MRHVIHAAIAASLLAIAGCELPNQGADREEGAPAYPGDQQPGADANVPGDDAGVDNTQREAGGGFRADLRRDLDDLQNRVERLRAEGSTEARAAVGEIEQEIGEIRSEISQLREEGRDERSETRDDLRQRLDRLEQRVDALEQDESPDTPSRQL